METAIPGPDGFVLSASDRLYSAHQLLNEYLSDQSSADLAKLKKLAKRQAIDLIEAILRRLAWLYQHDAELETAHVSRLRLLQLLRVLYTRKLPCTEPDLRMMLDLTVPLLDAIAPDGPVDYVMEYLKQSDLTPELCASLRNFQASLSDGNSQASMQSLRQRLHTLLWMDEWDPIDPKRCWSECIRSDFRTMTGERHAKWRRLLKNIRGNLPVRMPASWAKEAEENLASVTVEDFRSPFGLSLSNQDNHFRFQSPAVTY